MVQKAASTFDKHGSSQFLHTEQKIWGQTNDSRCLHRVHWKLFDINIRGEISID